MANYFGTCGSTGLCGCGEDIDPAATYVGSAIMGDVGTLTDDTDADTVNDSRLELLGSSQPPGHYLALMCNTGSFYHSVSFSRPGASGSADGYNSLTFGETVTDIGLSQTYSSRFELGIRYDGALQKEYCFDSADYDVATNSCCAYQFLPETTDNIYFQLWDKNDDPANVTSTISNGSTNPTMALYRLDPDGYIEVDPCPEVVTSPSYQLKLSISNTHTLFSWTLDIEYTWQGVTTNDTITISPGATEVITVQDNGATIIPTGTLTLDIAEHGSGTSLYSNSWLMTKILSGVSQTYIGTTDYAGDGLFRHWFLLDAKNSGLMIYPQQSPAGFGTFTVIASSGSLRLKFDPVLHGASSPYSSGFGSGLPIRTCGDEYHTSTSIIRVGMLFTSTVTLTLRFTADQGATHDVTWTIPPV